MSLLKKFILPPLEKSSGRDREVKQFGTEKVEEIIYQHLFLDKDHRQLDMDVLGKVNGFTKGRISANILYYYGIKGKNSSNRALFRGIFRGVEIQDAINYLEKTIEQKSSRKDLEDIKEIIKQLKNKDGRESAKEEEKSDFLYLKEVDKCLSDILNDNKILSFKVTDEAKEPRLNESISIAGRYRRDPKVATKSIMTVGFICEVNNGHTTFTSKKYNKPYMEAHHVVPFSFQSDFPNASLDVYANIVSLCPNCHRLLHHAVESEYKNILSFILNERASRLAKCNIHIDIDALLLMYKR